MKHHILLLLLICSLSVVAQSPGVYQYFDKDWNPVPSREQATYYRIVRKIGSRFLVTDYRASDDSRYVESVCIQLEPVLIRNGETVWYYPNGYKKMEGVYKNDHRTGSFRSYYESGAPNSEVIYRDQKVLHAQHWSTEGTPLLKNGNGTVTAPFIEVLSEPVNIDNISSYLEVKDSILLCSYTIRPERKDTVYSALEVAPEYNGGMDAFNNKLSKNLKLPIVAQAMGQNGIIYLQLVINKEGKPEDIKVLKGICNSCDEAVVRAVSKLKDWVPGQHKGKRVKTELILPVTIEPNKENIIALTNNEHPKESTPALIRSGAIVEYYSNGNKKEEGTYKDDKRIGLFRTYYENGMPNSEVIYGDGDTEETRYVQYWAPDGTRLLQNGTGIITGPAILDHDNAYMNIRDSHLLYAYFVRPEKADTIYWHCETNTEYRGGINAVVDVLRKNLKYPAEAQRKGIQGVVYIEFIVNKEGKPEELSVIKGIGHGCDEAALSVVSKLTEWIPGSHMGTPVRQKFVMPIRFKLSR